MKAPPSVIASAGTSAVDWGDAPSWISAAATVSTLIFAALAVIVGHRIYQIESIRDQVNADARRQQDSFLRRTQAALVSAWWGTHASNQDDDPARSRYGAFLRNASETPVYQAAITVVDSDNPDMTERFEIAVVPPASAPTFHPTQVDRCPGSTQLCTDLADRRVEVTFTDSTGVRWIRDQYGRLSELRPQVVVWADTVRARPLGQLAEEFLTTHGVRTSFQNHGWSTATAEMVADTDSADVPDVVLGPHDWLGYLIQQQAIERWAISPRHKTSFTDRTIRAVTHNGELYGMPYAVDSPMLIRNTALTPEAPTTFEELIADGQQLRGAGQVSHALAVPVGRDGEPFFMYPLLVAAGGWIFDRDPNGALTTGIIGVTRPESVAAFGRFRDLGDKGLGVFRRGVDEQTAIDLFIAGRTPYLLCCSWALGDVRRSGTPYAVSRIPPYAGHPPVRPMVSVESFFLTCRGANKTIARDWVAHHLMRTDVTLGHYQEQPRPLALQLARDNTLDNDQEVSSIHQMWLEGDLMPSMPEMIRFWPLLAAAELELIAGASPGSVARRLGQSLHVLLRNATG